MQPSLNSLVLTEDEKQAATKQIQELAYCKWKQSGCPVGAALRFWLEAEREWIEHFYVPDRYCNADRRSGCSHR